MMVKTRVVQFYELSSSHCFGISTGLNRGSLGFVVKKMIQAEFGR
jgi:hypothetical protein